ncbi:hypothetical protein D3C77_760980 [compost metagenome]
MPGNVDIGRARAVDLVGDCLAIAFAIDAVDGDVLRKAHIDTSALVADHATGGGQQGAGELKVARVNPRDGQGGNRQYCKAAMQKIHR